VSEVKTHSIATVCTWTKNGREIFAT